MKRSTTILGGALMMLSATSALGDTLVMQCTKSDCVRERCDDWRENCNPIGYFRRADGQYGVPQSHQVCNEFGDCHFAPPAYPPLDTAKSRSDSAAGALR